MVSLFAHRNYYFILSILATRLGLIAGKLIGKGVEVLGGLILIGIGLRILFSHIYLS